VNELHVTRLKTGVRVTCTNLDVVGEGDILDLDAAADQET
jgi:hypothetical protein